MQHQDLYYNTLRMLELKTLEIKIEVPGISIDDVASYYIDVILKNRVINNLNEAAYYIFNIKANRVVEYLNNRLISNQNISLDDFAEMFEKNNRSGD